jgi:hypothetical protein
MLLLEFEFYNAHTVVNGGQTFIVPVQASKPAYMVVRFPSQHLGEATVPQPGDLPLRQGALAGASWLAFELPADASIPYTLAALLDWTALTPQLVPLTSGPVRPDPLHTALEVPWSLWLSPPVGGTWQHSVTPVTAGGRTELWHTRLGVGGVEPPAAMPELVAFWPGAAGVPWPMSLTYQDRHDIVALTTSTSPGSGPALASFLALSSLGASISVQGTWSPSQSSGISLVSWLHRASAGRDSYVRAVQLGYLFPFGNRAVSITVTDREFHPDDGPVAYLVTRTYIVVTEPVLTYTGDPHEPFSGRANPIRSIEVKTVATPPIDFNVTADPGIQVGSLPTAEALWVRSGGADVPFSFAATDIEGRTVDFTTSVIWLESGLKRTDIGQVISAYEAAGGTRNSPSFDGQLLAFADTNGAKAGSTAQHVDSYTLTAKYAHNGAANFYPLLDSAVVNLPGAEQLIGAGSTPLPAPTVAISENYRKHGFQPGVTEIYLAVTANPPSLGFPVNLIGGLAAPNFTVSGIARDLGPVGGNLSKLLAGKFDPAQYFVDAAGNLGKLLGVIPVSEIIQAIDPDGPAANAQAPQISSTFVYPQNDDTKPPTALDTKLAWQPKVTGKNPKTMGFFKPNQGGTSRLLITSEIYTPISNPAQTTYSIHGELTDFELVLFGTAAPCIGIAFSSFTFDSKTGAKTSIRPQIKSVKFLGALTFINDLEQLLSSLGGPAIDVTAAGINASYTLALPDVSVGIFSLSNLSVTGGVNIPFNVPFNAPTLPVRVRLALCSQDNPFLLTIYLFGGGGYFSLAVGADGIEELQVELDFGASISIDLGVASGGVSIMAGIYFALQTAPTNQVQLTGFLRAGGNLSVLGLIAISMEFYLGLTYLNPGQCYGEAMVTVSVSVLFFSESVSVTMRKTLGGGSDPDFKDAISRAAWDTYCEAFATP